MKKVTWVKISVSTLLAINVSGCSDGRDEIVKSSTTNAPNIVAPKIEKFKKLDLEKLPHVVDGRARCACQSRTGGG